MENHHLYGGFHYTTEYSYNSEAAPPLAPPSCNNMVVSSLGSYSSDHHGHAGSTINNNVFLQHPEQDHHHEEDEVSKVIRIKVASHPLFPQLLHNYIDCRKVGAAPKMAQQLDEIREENIGVWQISPSFFDADPELDNFMEKYCNLLGKYKYEVSRPFEEATAFLNDMEMQLNSLICNGCPSLYDDKVTTGSSSLSVKGFITDEKETRIIDDECKKRINNNNDDRELKNNLVRRYSGYIGSLKNEFSKNKKKERLPNEAKEILQLWWNLHFKWPYPKDADKVALAEWTGLEQKQINNWFINQRKRHWKPSSQEIHAAVFDGICIMNDGDDDDISD